MSANEDSSFEQVGLSDLMEPVVTTWSSPLVVFDEQEKNMTWSSPLVTFDEEENKQKVGLEFPESFLQDTARRLCQEPATPNCGHGGTDQSMIASSSFVPFRELGKIKIIAPPHPSDDDESWQMDSKPAARQTVERIESSMNGHEIYRQCNSHDSLSSSMAKKRQLKEEELLFELVKSQEKKRKMLDQQPLIVRAQVLTNDIIRFVENYSKVETGFCTLPESSLGMLSSRFIEFIQSNQHQRATVTVGYHFSDKWRMTQIVQNGFGPNQRFSSNVDAAWQEGGCFQSLFASRSRASSIPENEAVDTEYLGWFVAVAEGCDDSFKEVRATSDNTAIVETRFDSYQSLPLLCFDASMRNQGRIELLLNGKYPPACLPIPIDVSHCAPSNSKGCFKFATIFSKRTKQSHIHRSAKSKRAFVTPLGLRRPKDLNIMPSKPQRRLTT